MFTLLSCDPENTQVDFADTCHLLHLFFLSHVIREVRQVEPHLFHSYDTD